MLHQPKTISNGIDNPAMKNFLQTDAVNRVNAGNEFKELFQQQYLQDLAELMIRLGQPTGKKNFLVSKHNKYINITTENIAYFYVRHDTTIIATLDKQEYFVDHSLEEIQNLLPRDQFFRVNRQYLVSFSAIKEVEHYFARKLLVNLVIPTRDKLLISKSKASLFLHWLDER